MTLPEVMLWNFLRGTPDGVIFRRQHPIDAYVLDFYCAKAKVCIEVDGIVHDMGENPPQDAQRDARLRALGIEVMRVPASDVLRAPEATAANIVAYCRRG